MAFVHLRFSAAISLSILILAGSARSVQAGHRAYADCTGLKADHYSLSQDELYAANVEIAYLGRLIHLASVGHSEKELASEPARDFAKSEKAVYKGFGHTCGQADELEGAELKSIRAMNQKQREARQKALQAVADQLAKSTYQVPVAMDEADWHKRGVVSTPKHASLEQKMAPPIPYSAVTGQDPADEQEASVGSALGGPFPQNGQPTNGEENL